MLLCSNGVGIGIGIGIDARPGIAGRLLKSLVAEAHGVAFDSDTDADPDPDRLRRTDAQLAEISVRPMNHTSLTTS